MKAPGFSRTVGFAIWKGNWNLNRNFYWILNRKKYFKQIYETEEILLISNLLLRQLLWDRQFESRRFCEAFLAAKSWRSNFEFSGDFLHSLWTSGIFLFFFDQFFPLQTIFWSLSNKLLVSLKRMRTPSRDKSTLKAD